ncbi:FtsX-like permease family protein [Streptomyces flavochromogenes]|uniref:FtsX-like permease family protein n=1 Tax=Streptomyces flavochromogenes TaxID=68199 RepID=A0ABW6XNS1_9ACTN|nr:FtsX-like permease family protein [Streptomyces flavochromogenes]
MKPLVNPAVRLLATRSLRAHRKAWAAVFAAVAVTSVLLGALALAAGSAGLGHARVERYAAAPVVVAGDQEVRWTTKPWGSETQTQSAGLTERVRIPSATVDVVRAVPGVRAAVPDHTFVVREPGTGAGAEPKTYPGRSWEAARLAPYRLADGREPRGAGEAVMGSGAGARVGDTVAGRKVVGLADGPAALYVTAAEARKLAGHPGSVDAVGVLAEPGVPVDTLHARVRAALDAAGLKDTASGQPLRALTGDGRGGPEHLAAAPARMELLQLLAAVSGTVVLVAVLVLASLVAQALQQRSGERELLLSVGATARQIRASAGREVTRVAGLAALCGAVAAVPVFLGLWSALRDRTGVVPEGLELPSPPWLFAASLVIAAVVVGITRLVVLFAARRPGRPGKGGVRRVVGIGLILLGVASAVTATAQGGEAAGAAAGAATVTLVAGCAVLGPWIAGAAMKVLDLPFRRLGGAPGRLTAAGANAHSRRLGAALVPVVLVTAFALVQLSAGTTMGRAADEQARAATTADLALTGTTAERVRQLPGVDAATDVLRSSVVLARTEAGAPRLDRLPVLGVDAAGLAGTLDPGVVAGDLAGLARTGTVAVGADMADSLDVRPGSTVELRLGDGTPERLRVVAVYERSLALGEFLLPKAELAPHMSDPYPVRVLASTAGATAGSPVQPEQVSPPGAELNGIVSAVIVSAIGGLTLLSVLSTLTLIGAGRRGELHLLGQVGASAGQLRRMLGLEAGFLTATGLLLGVVVAALPLTAFAWALTGGLPYLPPEQAALIAGTVVVTVVAGVFLPSRRQRA